jgi:hypothetical protein
VQYTKLPQIECTVTELASAVMAGIKPVLVTSHGFGSLLRAVHQDIYHPSATYQSYGP